MRIAFDTNVLLYAIDPDSGDRHVASSSLLDRAERGEVVLLFQTIAECFRVATTRKSLPAERVLQFLDLLRSSLPVQLPDLATFDMAVEAVRLHKIAFWDAMIWAAARQAGCQLLLSEDFQDGRVLGGVRIVNPFAAKNAAVLDAALPPA